jgi:hypothetical protein
MSSKASGWDHPTECNMGSGHQIRRRYLFVQFQDWRGTRAILSVFLGIPGDGMTCIFRFGIASSLNSRSSQASGGTKPERYQPRPYQPFQNNSWHGYAYTLLLRPTTPNPVGKSSGKERAASERSTSRENLSVRKQSSRIEIITCHVCQIALAHMFIYSISTLVIPIIMEVSNEKENCRRERKD